MSAALSLKTRISTPRFDETRDWYRALFGLALLEEWDEPGDRGCILGLNGPEGGAFLEIYQCAQDFDFLGLSLQFRVDDIADFSIPDDPRFVWHGPVDRPWGSRYLFFSDPNGISVVVFSGTAL
jgi:catechol 2,3-dioxygenase-like lactoylglutathione lyase family enzyme